MKAAHRHLEKLKKMKINSLLMKKTPDILKIRRIAAVFFVFVALLFAFVDRARAAGGYYSSFESSRIRIANESEIISGTVPEWFQFLRTNFLSWSPSGEQIVGDNKQWDNQLFHAIKMVTMRYSARENPFIQHFYFQLPGGVRIKALLATKMDGVRRPLIIVRTGIFSNSEEFYPERFILMSYFDQSPFNVLLVENMSGSEFLANHSSRAVIGGFDEGIQNIQLAKILKDPKEPISKIVGNVYLVGMSLGGAGVYYAALLNNLNKNLIQKFAAFCPVADFKVSFDNLLSSEIGAAVDVWSLARLRGLFDKWPDFEKPDIFETMTRKRSVVREAIERMAKTYNGPLSSDGVKLFAEMEKVKSDFWKAQDFLSFLEMHPNLGDFTVWATQKDPLVPLELNTIKVQNLFKELKLKTYSEGYHCSFPIAYNWEEMVNVYQNWIYQSEPEWKELGFKIKLQKEDRELIRDVKHLQILPRARASVGDHFVSIEYRFYDGVKRLPMSQDYKAQVFLKNTIWKFQEKILNKTHAEMLVRWANHQKVGLD